MKPQLAVCPTEESLVAFGQGKMDETASSSLASHLEICDACRGKVASAPADDFLDRLKQAEAARAKSSDGTVDRSQSETSLSGVDFGASVGSSETPGSVAAGGLSQTAAWVPDPNFVAPPELAASDAYEVLGELGRGGMGVVYLATNRLMGRMEVLKVVNRALLEKQEAADRFLKEIRAAARLSHQNVVQAYSAMQLGDLLVYAMEYVDGEDLARAVKSRGPIPANRACYYVLQAAFGLQQAFEAGMVHRDIKPSNLILSRRGKRHIVKVADFGLAKARSEGAANDMTGTGRMLGTPDYMAPEQALDAANADIRADIYSLGCTLFYLMTGRPPFRAPSLYQLLEMHRYADRPPLAEINPQTPLELSSLVARMMAKSPADRYQTPAETAKALTPFIRQPYVATQPVGNPILESDSSKSSGALKSVTPSLKSKSRDHGFKSTDSMSVSQLGEPGRNLTDDAQSPRNAQFIVEDEKAAEPANQASQSIPQSRNRLRALVLTTAVGIMLVAASIIVITVNRRDSVVVVNKPGQTEITITPDSNSEVAPNDTGKPPIPPNVAATTEPSPKQPKATTPEEKKKSDVAQAKTSEAPPKLQLSATLFGHTGPISHLVFSSDGTSVASASNTRKPGQNHIDNGNDMSVRIWNISTRAEIVEKQLKSEGGRFSNAQALRFSPNDRNFAFLIGFPPHGESYARVLDLTTRQFVCSERAIRQGTGRDENLRYTDVEFSDDNKTLLLARSDGAIVAVDLQSDKETVKKIQDNDWNAEQRSQMLILTFGPRHRSLACHNPKTGILAIYDSTSLARIISLKSIDQLSRISFAQDIPLVAIRTSESWVHVYDLAKAMEVVRFEVGNTPSPNERFQVGRTGTTGALSISPDGSCVATENSDSTISIHVASTGKELMRLSGHKSKVSAIAFSLDGKIIASADMSGVIHIWSPALALLKGGRVSVGRYAPEATKKGSEPSPVVQVAAVKAKTQPVVDAWSKLFNGKDKEGWQEMPNSPDHWEVKDSTIKSDTVGELYTLRDDFANFIFRAEAKLDQGAGGAILFRSTTTPRFKNCYALVFDAPKPIAMNSVRLEHCKDNRFFGFGVPTKQPLIEPGKWFKIELSAIGNEFVVRLDGKVIIDAKDPESIFVAGRFGLRRHRTGVEADIHFRNIEVREPTPATQANEKPVGFPIVQQFGDWSVKEGVVSQSSTNKAAVLLFGDPKWSDFDFTCDVKGLGEQPLGQALVARAQNPKQYYFFKLGPEGNTKLTFQRWQNGNFPLAEKQHLIHADRWQQLTVKARKNSFACFVNEVCVLNCLDSKFKQGLVGLRTFNCQGQFRKIKVTDPAGGVLLEGIPDL